MWRKIFIIREDDCGTDLLVIRSITDGKEVIEPLEERLIGSLYENQLNIPETGKVIVGPNVLITEDVAQLSTLVSKKLLSVLSLHIATSWRLPSLLWYQLGGDAVEVKEAVGTIAAQSISEPGTQLICGLSTYGWCCF